MKPLLAALFLASPAVAGSEHVWGTPADGMSSPSELRLAMCETDCFAQVAYTNGYIMGAATLDSFTLNVGGFEVRVEINARNLREAETFRVIPPPGFYAEPSQIEVMEGETATIDIQPIPMS